MITAVGFDLDDTLMEHSVAVARGLTAMVALREWPRRPDDISLWRELERQHYPRYVRGEVTFHGQRRARVSGFLRARELDPAQFDLDATFADYFALYRHHWSAVPGAQALLRAQRDAGRRIGILTNGPRDLQSAKLAHVGLDGLIDVLLAVDDLPEGKPHPTAFHALCARLGAEPASTAFVGDDLEADARGAANAGLRALWFRRPEGVGFSPDPEPGVPIADTLDEVRVLLA